MIVQARAIHFTKLSQQVSPEEVHDIFCFCRFPIPFLPGQWACRDLHCWADVCTRFGIVGPESLCLLLRLCPRYFVFRSSALAFLSGFMSVLGYSFLVFCETVSQSSSASLLCQSSSTVVVRMSLWKFWWARSQSIHCWLLRNLFLPIAMVPPYVLPQANLHRICTRGCVACCPTYWARELVELLQYCALIALVGVEFETGGWLENFLLQCAQLMQIKHVNFHEQEVESTRDGNCTYINCIS